MVRRGGARGRFEAQARTRTRALTHGGRGGRFLDERGRQQDESREKEGGGQEYDQRRPVLREMDAVAAVAGAALDGAFCVLAEPLPQVAPVAPV